MRGFANTELQEFSAAEADFEKALQLQPDRDALYALHVNRGNLRVKQRRFTDARADLQQAVLKFRQAGVTHITYVQLTGDIQAFTNDAQQQGVHWKYGLPDDQLVSSTYGSMPPNFQQIKRPFGQIWRRHILPALTAIARDMHEAVIRACPEKSSLQR